MTEILGIWILKLLTYLGKAAAAYEERIDIQKARLLSRLEESQDPPHAFSATPEVATTSATPLGSSNDAIAASAIPDDSNEGQSTDAAAAALSATVFEQIISAATGDETSSNEDAAGESSESDSDEDRDSDTGFEESERQAIENNDSSSSSSGSDAEPGEDEQVESDEEEDDIVLRQALALSLVEQNQNQSLRVDTTSRQDDEQAVIPESTPSSCPVTPGNETPISTKEPGVVSDVDDSPLPPLPTPPKFYPYASMLDSTTDSDEGASQFFDPSALSRFGTLPTTHVLVHLLRYTVMIVERRKFRDTTRDETNTRKDGHSTSSISGGIGCSLFPPKHPFIKSQKPPDAEVSDAGVSMQLLVALFLLTIEKRNGAIDNLRKAFAQESRGVQEGEDEDAERKDSNDSPLSSEEGDDPAIAMALHYVDEDMSETKESLGGKGNETKSCRGCS